MTVILWLCCAAASLSFMLFFWNLMLFRRASGDRPESDEPVSVLIPARNEAASIGGVLESVLANRGVTLEVVVLDDASEDNTAAVVERISKCDSRVRLAAAPPLPEGWCGKQHACSVLATLATHDVLCFVDADVRLSPDALSRMLSTLQRSSSDLISGFPRQQTVTFLERLLLPQIHLILLGYLPVAFMRSTRSPGFAAGCGQLMMARRDAYRQSGGHAAIRTTLHDGILLPRTFRRAGLRTDIFDATDTASCRMYRGASQVWHGLAKNAVEGLAAPSRLPFFTLLLLFGHVLPFALIGMSTAFAVPLTMSLAVRLAAAWRFRQPLDSALLHPLGVSALLVLQWYALARYLLRRPSSWKGRAYASGLQTGGTTSSIPSAPSR